MKSQEANAIPLRDILEKYGHEPVRSYHGYLMYSSPFRSEGSPSFRVDLNTNRWKDFGEDTSGGVADLVMRLEKCDFHSAMRRIEKGDLSTLPRPSSIPAPTANAGVSPRLSVDNVNSLTNRMLLDYMSRRGIDADIAKAYCKEVYYHFGEVRDKPCFAIGFPNDKGGMELRNPMFKGCAGVKAVTCLDNGSDRCAVFEGFMDFLSYLQYAREHPGLPPMNFCILNSTAMADRSGEFLSRHRLVHAFLDNDKAGLTALERMGRILGKDTVLVNESVRLYPKHNDFNEFLQACKKKVMAVGNEM